MTTDTPHGPRVCYDTTPLPLALLAAAPRMDPTSTRRPEDVEERAVCSLEEWHGGSHYGLALDLPGEDTGSVWAVWSGETPVLLLRPDCPASSADGMDGCGLFAGHSGRHTWELYDREAAIAWARLAGSRLPLFGGGGR